MSEEKKRQGVGPRTIAGASLLLAGAFLVMDKSGRQNAVRVLNNALKLMDAEGADWRNASKQCSKCGCSVPEVVHTCEQCMRAQQ